ncbi:hypothetical protein FRC03_005594 [Tulasnella sp. 419]|nr:hypothetical protein FRC03_005594 [Tulasnella sp. 419]
MLFTEVALPFERRALQFLRALQSNSSLGMATKILDFKNYNSFRYSVLEKSRVTPLNQIKTIVGYCPQLYQLLLSVSPNTDREYLETLFPPHTFATLRALHFSFDGRQHRKKFLGIHDIPHFLHQFSSLSHLRLENTSLIRQPDLDTHLPLPPSFELYEFTWINSVRVMGRSSADDFCYITHWLFGKSSISPHIFGLDDCDIHAQTEILSYFLKSYGGMLKSLGTRCPDEFVGVQLAETCPNLRELVLYNGYLLSPRFRLSIPTTYLEHLGFCLLGDLSPKEVILDCIDWISEIPNLRCVTQSAWYIPEDFEWEFAQDWKERCRSRVDLRFECLDNNYYFTSRDLVPTDQFPRQSGTLSNLSLMIIPHLSGSD